MTSAHFLIFFSVLIGAPILAHDGGHGPNISDAGKQGGVMAPVIETKHSDKGHHAEPVYKAEMVRSEDGTVRIFLYDLKMTPLGIEKFAAAAKGIVEFKKNKKWVKDGFDLKPEEGAYLGKAPRAKGKPFNIDITFKDAEGRELLAAFNNLD